MVSIIVPHYLEPYLDKTLKSLKDSAGGEIEILAIEGVNGMRAAVNEGLRKAQGDFIMKTDAHCLFGPNYDTILASHCQNNWLVTPRRYPLHADEWRKSNETYRDYHYLSSPTIKTSYGRGIFPLPWDEKTRERKDIEVDDIMTMQGSCWFANRKYFMEHVGFLDDNPATYGSFTGEPLEIGMKYWLNGGEMKVVKAAWYAHLYKNQKFYKDREEANRLKRSIQRPAGHEWGARHWINNEEPGMTKKFEWLIDKFWPIPGWPEDWKEQWNSLSAN